MNRRVPKYRHHKARNLAFVQVRGRYIYLGKFGSPASKEKYSQIVQQLALDGEVSLRRRPDDVPTVVEICAQYWRYAKRRYADSPSRLDHIRRTVRRLRNSHGRTPVSEFGPASLDEHRHSVLAGAGRRLTRRYINEHIQRVRRIFKWAASREKLAWEVYHRLTLLEGVEQGSSEARDSEKVRPVEDEIVERTLPHLPPVIADMVQIQRLTGMRPGEVCALRPCDLARDGDVWEYVPPSHKSRWRGLDRRIPIGPRAQAILLPYVLRASTAFCFSPAESEANRLASRHAARKTPMSHGNVPGGNRQCRPRRSAGRRYRVDSYRKAVRRVCEKTGIPKWFPNQLRHAAATEIRDRDGIEAAQSVLGHERMSTTEVYTQRRFELAREIALRYG